jgi:hypothetical protein
MLRRTKSRVIHATPHRLMTSSFGAVLTVARMTTAVLSGAMAPIAFADAVETVIAGLALSTTAGL